MNKETKINKTKVALNASTDPGVKFNIGNAAMNFAHSSGAGTINVGTGVLCLAIRTASELKKQGANLPLPRWFNKLVENPGAAIMTNGVFLGFAAIAAATDIDTSRPETALPTIISAAFSAGCIAQGSASHMEDTRTAKKLRNAFAQVAYAAGMFLAAAPHAPMPIKAAFITAGAIGAYCGLRNKEVPIALNPNLLIALGAAGSAYTSTATNMLVANIFWSAAYISLFALDKYGGIAEMTQAIRKNPEATPEP